MNCFAKTTQTGRSMIEVMGYMIVSMFLIAGVAKIVTGAYANYKLSQASIQISDLAKTIVKVSAADTDYLNTIDNIKEYLPKSYRVVGDNIYNVFGGEVRVGVPGNDDNTDHPGDQFYIRFFGLDRDQCIAMITKEWTNNRVVDLYSIILNGADYWFWPVYHPAENSHEHTLPVKMADVAGTDSNGLCGDDNNIMWVFN